MKIYVLLINDYEENEFDDTQVEAFTTEEAAREAFEKAVQEVHEYWADNDLAVEDKSDTSYSAYTFGEYSINHTDVWYKEVELKA